MPASSLSSASVNGLGVASLKCDINRWEAMEVAVLTQQRWSNPSGATLMHAPEERWSNSGASRVVPLAPLDYAAELIGEKVGASELAPCIRRRP